MKIHNFSAGPAILPKIVLEEAAQAILNFNNRGLSILEVSHRGKDIIAVVDEAEALIKELLGVGDDYKVLFLSGGASTQFFMVPMNLLDEHETAAYLNTGVWADKAIEQAVNYGKIDVVGSSKDANYTFIPKDYEVKPGTKYLHYTTNNTVYGTQFHQIPKVPEGCLLVADMSSDIFCRPVDGKKFDLIYAGAQKNLGPAGVTIVVVKKSILGSVTRKIPTMLDYRVHVKNESMYNTPPVYPIYVTMLTLRWIKAMGGLSAMERRNKTKAELLYAEIDRNPYFVGTTAQEDRSWMNATFLADSPEHEAAFLDYCKANNVDGIAGHRSVGGFRASMYNAMDLDSVQFLVELMQNFKP
jgi:phosphoserine aminotransferase